MLTDYKNGIVLRDWVTNYEEGGGATKREGGGAREILYLPKCISHAEVGAHKVLG